MADRDITIHPYDKETEQIDDTTNIYPNVKLHNIKNEDGSNANLQKEISIGSESSNYLTFINDVLNLQMVNIIKTMYPVGSIFMTLDTNATKGPNDYLKPIGATYSLEMTWTPITDTFLYAADENHPVGNTGGSNDAAVVQHTHTMSNPTNLATASFESPLGTVFLSDFEMSDGTVRYGHYEPVGQTPTRKWTIKPIDHMHTVSSTGDVGTNKNMPKYLCVRMWRRTA